MGYHRVINYLEHGGYPRDRVHHHTGVYSWHGASAWYLRRARPGRKKKTRNGAPAHPSRDPLKPSRPTRLNTPKPHPVPKGGIWAQPPISRGRFGGGARSWGGPPHTRTHAGRGISDSAPPRGGKRGATAPPGGNARPPAAIAAPPPGPDTPPDPREGGLGPPGGGAEHAMKPGAESPGAGPAPHLAEGPVYRQSAVVDGIVTKRFGVLTAGAFVTFRRPAKAGKKALPSKVWPLDGGCEVGALRAKDYILKEGRINTLWSLATGRYTQRRLHSFAVAWPASAALPDPLILAFKDAEEAGRWQAAFTAAVAALPREGDPATPSTPPMAGPFTSATAAEPVKGDFQHPAQVFCTCPARLPCLQCMHPFFLAFQCNVMQVWLPVHPGFRATLLR